MRQRLRAIAFLLSAFAAAGCRETPLCARMLTAPCPCPTPGLPYVPTCVAQVDVPGCELDGPIDVCALKPCCPPLDAGPVARDAGADQSPPADAHAPEDLPAVSDGAPSG